MPFDSMDRREKAYIFAGKLELPETFLRYFRSNRLFLV